MRKSALIALLVCLPNTSVACRLALVLAMDISGSVDSEDYALQFHGLARAFRHKDIRAAILNQGGPVAVMTFEWSGTHQQTVVSDWIVLSTHRDIDRLAVNLEHPQRSGEGHNTAIGKALKIAHQALVDGPECARKVIDVSGDGYNNDGPTPLQIYQDLDFTGIIVNALVIGGIEYPKLHRYFETDVIRGPGAFTIGTRDFADYPGAIAKKLLRELTPYAAMAKLE